MDVFIGGLDPAFAKGLEADVRRTIVDLRIDDVQVVAVLPSDAKNRWDVGVRRATGWSVTWFDAAVEDLTAQVTDRLRASIDPTRVSRV